MEQNRNEGMPYNEKVAAGKAGGVIAEYIVEEKDTLPDIARRYGVSIEEIMEANRETLKEPADFARPGLRIWIPRKMD